MERNSALWASELNSVSRQPLDAMNANCTILAILLLFTSTGCALAEFCDNGTGDCRELTATDCPVIFYNEHLIGTNIKYCDEFNDIVCCPLPLNAQKRNQQPVDTRRLFEKECRRYNDARPTCRSTPLILDGTRAKGRELPFMALLGTRMPGSTSVSWDCGGTLIHPRFVLTAAHCLETSESKEDRLDPNFESPKFVVRLGELDYNSTTDDAQPQDFSLVNYVLHPDYNADGDDGSRTNDIAVLELDRNAAWNEYVAPACLPTTSGDEFENLNAAGWGYQRNSGNKSSHLLTVGLQRYSNEECAARLESRIIPRTQFCAGPGSSNRKADTCNGDSGGPIYVQHPTYNCLKLIIGITSYGKICGNYKFPSAYTKVHLYTEWIETIVWGE